MEKSNRTEQEEDILEVNTSEVNEQIQEGQDIQEAQDIQEPQDNKKAKNSKKPKKRRSLLKKIITRTAIVLGSLVALISLAICIALYFVFTPERITPIVKDIAQEYVTTDLEIKGVELTFFSTFPNFSVKIDTLAISLPVDTLAPLLYTEHFVASINPMALLDNEVVVNSITIEGANINLYVDSLVKPFTIFKFPSDTSEIDTLSEDSTAYNISLDKINILSSNITVDDRRINFYSRFEDLSLELAAKFYTDIIDLDMVLDLPDIYVDNNNEILANHEALNLTANLNYKIDSMLLSINQANLLYNSIDLKTNGTISTDSTQSILAVDISTTLSSPSISEFLKLIPPTVIDQKESLNTEGIVDLAIDFKGVYSDTSKPLITAKVLIENGKARYGSRKVYIEDIDCDAFVYLDLNKPKNSYTTIKNFNISSTEIIDLTLSGKIKNLMTDPIFDVKILSDIDFNRLAEVFPLKEEGIRLRGTNSSNLTTQVTLSDITSSNYGKLYITGESIFTDLRLGINAAKFMGDSTYTGVLIVDMKEGKLLFGDNVRDDTDSRTLLSTINLSEVKFMDRESKFVLINELALTAGANFDNKTSTMNGVGVTINAQDVDMGIEDELDLDLKSAAIKLTIPPKSETRGTRITGSISSDSTTLFEYANNSAITLSQTNADLELQDLGNKEWDRKGKLNFQDMEMYSDIFPIDVTLSQSSLEIDNNIIKLNNTRMRMGESNLVATGSISNLIKVMFLQDENAQSRNNNNPANNNSRDNSNNRNTNNRNNNNQNNLQANNSRDNNSRDNNSRDNSSRDNNRGNSRDNSNSRENNSNNRNNNNEQLQINGVLNIRSQNLNLTELTQAINQSVMLSDTTLTEDESSSTEMLFADNNLQYRDNQQQGNKRDNSNVDLDNVDFRPDRSKRDSTLTSRRNTSRMRQQPEAQSSMFLVPKNINFDLTLDLAKVQYESGSVESVKGKATIRDGILSLEKISLRTIGAEALSTVTYQNVNNRRSKIRMDLNLTQVDINRINELMPAIDTLMPMITAFEGSVDCELTATGLITNRDGFNFATVKAALDMRGRDLVLMDSETFTSVSKLLWFKNKDKNTIDSMNLLVIADSSRVDVLPFSVDVDRYTAIIGGTQVVDTSYNIDFEYNISITKSPLPFKAGVDIMGNLDDYDYKITTAKLKKTDFGEQDLIFQEFKKSIGGLESIDSSEPPKNRGVRKTRIRVDNQEGEDSAGDDNLENNRDNATGSNQGDREDRGERGNRATGSRDSTKISRKQAADSTQTSTSTQTTETTEIAI